MIVGVNGEIDVEALGAHLPRGDAAEQYNAPDRWVLPDELLGQPRGLAPGLDEPPGAPIGRPGILLSLCGDYPRDLVAHAVLGGNVPPPRQARKPASVVQ